MSTIEKLSIQGVRSFGCNAEDCQSITFSSPVSLILGENGCGKTTIIECLKYVLTGDCPPGSNSGKHFVHDPKIYGLSESLAQIKVQIRNKVGARISVCRLMKVSMKRDKVSFETLSPTINYMNDKANELKNHDFLGGRIADIGNGICDFMGVSKAIINDVLFCHQEDASWPLDEPKKLKEKFDDIFGISEYDKALDKIIKMRKEAQEEIKVMDANMKLLFHLKQEMEVKTMNLERAQQKCDSIKAQCAQCDEEVKPIDARLGEIRDIEYDISKYQAQKVEMDTKHKNCIEQISSIAKKIKKPFEGSLAELDIEIRSFDQRMSELRLQRTDVEEHLFKIKNNRTELQTTLVAQDKKRCIAQQQQQSEQECKSQLVKGLKALCEQLQIPVKSSLDMPEEVADLMHDIEVTLMSKQCEIAELTANNDQADHERQTKIDELRTELTKSVEGVSTQEKQREASEKEIAALELKIKQIETSMHQLKLLEKEIADIDEKYERATRSFNLESIREVIATKKAKISEKQARFKKLDEQLTFLNSIAKLMAEITLKEKELEKKDQEVQRVRNKHSDHFGKFFKENITSNYRRAMQGAYDKLRRDIKDLTDKANAEKLKEQSHNIGRKNLKTEIARMEKELAESEELIFQKCHSTPYDELLERNKAVISKLQLEHGALKSAEAMYKKYIQKIEEEPCCPLCHHNMSGDEATDLTSELADEIHKLPVNISVAEKSLKAEQLKYENLLQMKPLILKVKDLKESVPKKKEELRKIEELLGDAVNQYETQMAMLGEPTHNLELANSMLGDMTILDEALKEAARLKKDLDVLKLKLPSDYDSSVSIDAVQSEKVQVSEDLETERKALEANQQTYEKQTEALNCLREKKNKLKDHQIKLQEGVQSLPQLKERLDELTRLMITIGTEISALKSKINPLKQKLNAAITEKARLKESERSKLAELNSKYNSYRSADENIQRLNTEVRNFNKLDLKIKIQEYDASIKSIKDKVNQLDTDIASSSEKLETIKTECLNQQTIDRDLKDNRELKQLQKKEIDLMESCEALAKQLGNLDFGNISREKQGLIKKKDAASIRRGALLGQLGEINSQIEKLKLEIEEPKYKQSLKNYRKAHFELMVARHSIDDLAQHRDALEWALIQFHSEKMDNINRLIREYWRLIYRGNDIDYIQIRTQDQSNKSANRRKSYNYRVVQSKNNSEIEMRGRCSAGQRVLASLIIRMALAETFSSNCGVLALDEPTTNLDQANIISLCDALNRIVEERQSHSNFMLIIITHDENFISTLGNITSYHRVARNHECKSTIRNALIE
ncbi:DNA repair protein RAD50 [Scaptodrosophila lebanonensis]|uniref:DNA repair protein RAD50 n=1 Tax=Drosophila lebanonensis TaxID=7225 RepID=A0A6J2UBR7_DROLE|nr:DNA repair protein RAD50 [Scaptodrosophila lebanonensis]